jgi:hypothetical protein
MKSHAGKAQKVYWNEYTEARGKTKGRRRGAEIQVQESG